MDKYLQECLHSKLAYTGSVLPFFWQHGEDHAVLKEEQDAIRASGATEFCIESRPHEGFCQESWWEDVGFMMEYARDYDMKVWILDDKNFPTGYANGYITEHPELKRTCIRMDYRDYTGPVFKAQIRSIGMNKAAGDYFVSITAWKRSKDFKTVVGEPIDLLARRDENGLILWDIPEGTWRVYYVLATRDIKFRPEYIDVLSPESCKAMLHAVYEPHYEHFSEYFGNVFRGFFSDEPGMFNAKGSYRHKLGTEDLWLPWRTDLCKLMGETMGCEEKQVSLMLPALWHTLQDQQLAPALRAAYMDIITRLYSENFTQMLGQWCQEHDVLYIGHVIEDNNAHQRLGYGPGHFFRALHGQHMSGIDIVLNQIVPGNLDIPHIAPVAEKVIDPAFFHYALAKLGASAAHAYPEMQNRFMAEVFGAFGWAEGVGHMKYLADHMLVNGVNHFVPHAYSPKYPDRDHPPHFHAGGLNPQEPAFGLLIQYMQRISRLTDDSVHKADVAVFYNAEAEWAGGECTLFQETCKRLSVHQIDYDILPEDILAEAGVEMGRLIVNQESFGALIVPYSEILPKSILESFQRLQEKGLPVIFEDGACVRTADGTPAEEVMAYMQVTPGAELADYIRSQGWYHVKALADHPGLRVYHVQRAENSVYLLFNEARTLIDTTLQFADYENCVIYEGWKNKLYKPQPGEKGIRIKLAFGQALAIITNQQELLEELPEYPYDITEEKELDCSWKISMKDAGSQEYRELKDIHHLVQFNLGDFELDFCGTIRYETAFTSEGTEQVLDLGYVGEIATVWLNDISCGTVTAAPYIFEVDGVLRPGINKLVIEVINSPVYRERKVDVHVTFLPMVASGLLGPVKLGKVK